VVEAEHECICRKLTRWVRRVSKLWSVTDPTTDIVDRSVLTVRYSGET
jgi:hypothetical protein